MNNFNSTYTHTCHSFVRLRTGSEVQCDSLMMLRGSSALGGLAPQHDRKRIASKDHKTIIQISCLSVLLVLGACTPKSPNLQTIRLLDPDHEVVIVQVEIADDPSERTQGLMFRENLPKGEGMLFVFEEERPLSFWMKNTLIPLDILFFDNAGKWVSSTQMVPCSVDPCPRYSSIGVAKFALEVPFGFTEEYGVGAGWVLQEVPWAHLQ